MFFGGLIKVTEHLEMHLMIYFLLSNGNILMEKSFKTKKKFLQKLNYFARYGKIKILPEVDRAFRPFL